MLVRKAFAGVAVCLAPGAFAQANFAAMDTCLAEIVRIIPRGSSIADLHAGVGTIGVNQPLFYSLEFPSSTALC